MFVHKSNRWKNYIYQHIDISLLFDILDITEPEAKVLRAIAYYEAKSGEKGATSYLCQKKVPNGFHVSNSTFNEHIKKLENKVLVFPYDEKEKSKHNPNYYTITDLGQIAWLKYFADSKNLDIIKKVFPNILLSDIDKIIEKIDHPTIKEIKNGVAFELLKLALDSYHIFESASAPKIKLVVEERIELSTHAGLMRTSYGRYFHAVDIKYLKKLTKQNKEIFDPFKNFDQLEISVIDRVTFLFYYNLIQLVTDTSSLMIFVKITSFLLAKVRDTLDVEPLEKLLNLSKLITKKRSEILEKINSNKEIAKIMKYNLKDLNEYKYVDFQNISKLFIKT